MLVKMATNRREKHERRKVLQGSALDTITPATFSVDKCCVHNFSPGLLVLRDFLTAEDSLFLNRVDIKPQTSNASEEISL